jgi:hypothetical protein
LTAHDLTLKTCRHADLDRWLTDDSATYRQTAGHFIRWARTNKLTAVHVPAIRRNGPTQPLDDEHRWNIARRLLHDEGPQARKTASQDCFFSSTPKGRRRSAG